MTTYLNFCMKKFFLVFMLQTSNERTSERTNLKRKIFRLKMQPQISRKSATSTTTATATVTVGNWYTKRDSM